MFSNCTDAVLGLCAVHGPFQQDRQKPERYALPFILQVLFTAKELTFLPVIAKALPARHERT